MTPKNFCPGDHARNVARVIPDLCPGASNLDFPIISYHIVPHLSSIILGPLGLHNKLTIMRGVHEGRTLVCGWRTVPSTTGGHLCVQQLQSCSCTWELSIQELQMSMSCNLQVYITSLHNKKLHKNVKKCYKNLSILRIDFFKNL